MLGDVLVKECYCITPPEAAEATGCCDWVSQAQSAEKKASRKAVLDRIAAEGFSTCLIEPFVEAATAGDRPRACAAVAQAWLTYIHLVQVHRMP